MVSESVDMMAALRHAWRNGATLSVRLPRTLRRRPSEKSKMPRRGLLTVPEANRWPVDSRGPSLWQPTVSRSAPC